MRYCLLPLISGGWQFAANLPVREPSRMSLARHNKSQFSVRIVGSPHFRGADSSRRVSEILRSVNVQIYFSCKFKTRPARKIVIKREKSRRKCKCNRKSIFAHWASRCEMQFVLMTESLSSVFQTCHKCCRIL